MSASLICWVQVVDWDVHHGQGVQRLLAGRPDVLSASLHRYERGRFWPRLREADLDALGTGPGLGRTINVPLDEVGMGDVDFLSAMCRVLLPVLREFRPDIVLVCAGYDAALGCPEGVQG